MDKQSQLLDRVGVVASIARYPVKSVQAELLETAALHWTWLHGDRQYAFVKEADTSAFPWLTARDMPELVRFTARYERPDDPVHSAVIVTDPRGTVFDVRSPMLAELLSETTGAKVRLLRLGRGCFDAMAISMLTTTMAATIEQAHGAPVASERFRANLVIRRDEPASTEPAWVGRSIAVGTEGACLDVGWEIPRCAMVAIDPDTGARDPTIVRTVAQRFGNRAGVYCSVRQPGVIHVGDAVAHAVTAPTG
ncbi:MAG: MOSC domain-containing protein [Janthinobacterium lividum]